MQLIQPHLYATTGLTYKKSKELGIKPRPNNHYQIWRRVLPEVLNLEVTSFMQSFK